MIRPSSGFLSPAIHSVYHATIYSFGSHELLFSPCMITMITIFTHGYLRFGQTGTKDFLDWDWDDRRTKISAGPGMLAHL
jgi:hypothetical protein